jgi:hypothetical protein
MDIAKQTRTVSLTKNFDIKLSIYLITGFILFTAVGTVSHELGHYTAAKLLGHNASFNYGYTFYGDHVPNHDSFVITLCGPLQTMITGSIGFLLLFCYKHSFYASKKLNFRQWLLVFVALFWLRELFNFVQGFGVYFLKGHFPHSSDEVRLAEALHIHPLSFTLPAAVIAFFILVWIVFKYIPLNQRLTFLISGLIGGLAGMYLWLYSIGPMVMP